MPSAITLDRVVTDADLIQKGASDRGGWSRAQVKLLGIDYPLPHGWKRSLIGRSIPATDARRFLELRNAHLEGRDGRPKGETAARLHNTVQKLASYIERTGAEIPDPTIDRLIRELIGTLPEYAGRQQPPAAARDHEHRP